MTVVDFIYSFILAFGLFVAASCFWYEKKTKAPAIPTLPWVRKKMIEALKRHTDPSKPYRIAELGSGWGGIAVRVARAYPKSTIIGYEIAIFPYLVSVLRGLFTFRKIKFRRDDFFNEDLSQYDIVICYLLPWHMAKLKPQMETLKPGSIVVVNAYGVPGWEPIETQYTDFVVKIPIYVYKR
jgi:hypothetical protein